MSVEAMTWAFAQPIPPAPKVVLLALANEANKLGQQCFPSLATLVENCAPMKKRTIQNHLRWLADEAKLITITPWFTERGRQTSNLYELVMATRYCGEGAESCTHPERTVSQGEGAESCRGRVQKAARGRVQELLHGEGARAVAPSDKNLNPVVDLLEGLPVSSRRRGPRQSLSSNVWEGLRRGYHKRYGFDPVRDAATNTALCALVKSFGEEEAIRVAEFYCSLDRKVYVENGHPPNLLMRDRHGIRMQLQRGPVPPPVVGPKSYQTATVPVGQWVECPPEAAEKLSKLLGRRSFSFEAEQKEAV